MQEQPVDARLLAMVVNDAAYLLDKRGTLKSIAGKPRSYSFLD
ncbi:hypothetical protein C4K36_2595 [Pseudomonas chlororaphis subsp. piscium]|nr:hypothetical protein C4K36_2595 [Pseudomonas chlororaphis subsp. piscium]AZC69246.1 hypothetical protein C4K32_2584 [Pseudomonas chlororaphis subsp. piscium]